MLKRIFDIILSGALLIMLMPVLIIVALLIRYHLGSPIFFYQNRPGLHGKTFRLIKFRTMRDSFNKQGELLPDKDRLTRLGHVLRACSLDELPQLWNVFKGEMSFVGPRPLLIEYLSLYNSEQKRRHDVKPGITGLAQVNGRNALNWEGKFALDLWYVDHQSFYLDIKILMLTFKKVLIREGITGQGSVTNEKFTGNNP
ncbi:sugar transferase [Fluoribacter gormanii]|uniref:Colanic biosynthesis UDP-glucose lipid carrier transferase n=1 Tax=Fluoribacter gormanii TaxID=464 RepID=A0A377GFV1_9GAMM|nr:sugar transferase [Fluoribacter gormanii]KTD04599.1 putative sugar transferase EpsL [Fluoribacter gormanii]SIR33025.1 Sugar transferase involved in LPS biosynthesis (colanic, teichoic acid) [Fluoribacter gormanii]STO23395.1 Putative colanic biosynthesis UDP-glucose lipid carrier transferase [Fluoribacter gormanii]